MLIDSPPWDPEPKKVEKVEKNISIAQRYASQKWWRSTCLATGLARSGIVAPCRCRAALGGRL